MLKVTEIENIDFRVELLEEFSEIIKRYPEGKHKAALLPILHLVQAEYGWLSTESMERVANFLDLQPIEVFEVATFYTMFFLKPQGQFVLEVCRTGPCCLVGAEKIIKYIETKLGVKEGEVTSDGRFSWRGVECLAACGMAPVLQIGPDYTFYENLTEEKVDQLIQDLKQNNEAIKSDSQIV
ncbi:MAG: NAD(P)H-dependent oxidoreductase subunit E [Flavobacterium sp.]|nr:NAD(P)H-dependent oxidoreductase subunit E [Pedobacter sp.]